MTQSAKPHLLFTGCLIETQFPYLEKLAVELLPRVGIQIERESFLCCPEPISFRATDVTWLAMAARNLCKAEERGMDIISLCNGCVNSMEQANAALKKDSELRDKVNVILAEIGMDYKGTIEVKHFLQVLNENVGTDRIGNAVFNI